MGQDDDALRPPLGPRTAMRFDSDPPYEVTEVNTVPARVPAEFWILALEHGERTLLCDAAEAFVRAKREDLPGIPENAGAALLSAFQKTVDQLSREALATALIELSEKSAIDELSQAVNQGDYRFDHIVEPALARWQVAEVQERNRNRLADANALTIWRKHAIAVAEAGQDSAAKEELLKVIFDDRERTDLRLSAAQCLGKIETQGLSEDADRLLSDQQNVVRIAELLALELLRHHHDPDSLPVLKRLTSSSEPTVQAGALQLLQAIGPEHVIKTAADLDLGLEHPHAGLRATIIESAYAIGDVAAVVRLAQFLDDPLPANREMATDAMFDLSQRESELLSAVKEHVNTALTSDSWRVLVQACLLAAGLKMGDTAPRMAELLTHARTEVGSTAAYAIKVFANEDLLPIALRQVESNLEKRFDTADPRRYRDLLYTNEQTQHLSEFMGMLRYRSADPILQRLIPKKDPDNTVIGDPRTRAIGIWAIGQIRMGEPDDEQLVAALTARLNDNTGPRPEQEPVREGCAYALGWMKAEQSLEALQSFAGRSYIRRCTPAACAWAVSHLTGEPMQLDGPLEYEVSSGWFLGPTREVEE